MYLSNMIIVQLNIFIYIFKDKVQDNITDCGLMVTWVQFRVTKHACHSLYDSVIKILCILSQICLLLKF